MSQITNSTKAAIIAAVNSIIALGDVVGIHSTSKTTAIVFVVVNLALGAAAFFTRKLSPRWQASAVTVANDVTKVAGEVAAIKQAAPKLAAATAAEVPAAYQDLPRIGGVVQHEVLFRRSVGVIAPVAEKIVPETLSLGSLQKAGGDDLVGVDVLDRHRHRGTP